MVEWEIKSRSLNRHGVELSEQEGMAQRELEEHRERVEDDGLVRADAATAALAQAPMMLQLSSGDGSRHMASLGGDAGDGEVGYHGFPLGLSLEQGKGGYSKPEDASGSGKRFRDDIVDDGAAAMKNVFHGQSMPTTIVAAPHPPTIRPRVRARRGQATDPHSIAERLCRERIAERIRALQELVPSVNKRIAAVMDTNGCQPFYLDIQEFYERLGIEALCIYGHGNAWMYTFRNSAWI